MTHDEFMEHLAGFCASLNDLSNSKGVEYANDTDQLANFKREGQKLGLPPEAVAHVYLSKHLDATAYYVRSLSQGSKFEASENITGRLRDAALYLVLLDALIYERQQLLTHEQGEALRKLVDETPVVARRIGRRK